MFELGTSFSLFVVFAVVWLISFFAWALLSERR